MTFFVLSAVDQFELECGQLNHKYYHHVNITLFHTSQDCPDLEILKECKEYKN